MFSKNRSRSGHQSFTLRGNNLLREIIVDCYVSFPWHPQYNNGTNPPSLVGVKALWDTGATNCCISQHIIDTLKLKPHDKTEVHHAGGKTIENVFNINIVLPNDTLIPFINVTQCKFTTGKFDLIVGMDLITLGDFAITNLNSKTVISFKIPSTYHIDFNKEEYFVSSKMNKK